MSIHGPSREFILFRNASAAYFAAYVMHSQAQFTIKNSVSFVVPSRSSFGARGDNPIVAKKLYRSQSSTVCAAGPLLVEMP